MKSVTITREDLGRAWDIAAKKYGTGLLFTSSNLQFRGMCEALGLDEDEPKEVREWLWEYSGVTNDWCFIARWMTEEQASKFFSTKDNYKISSLCPEGRIREK